MVDTTARALYTDLEAKRKPFLDRGQQGAALTIPTLLPEDGHQPTSSFLTPHQGLGARGLRNIASRLLLSLFPPNAPFFRFVVDEFTLAKIAGSADAKTELDEALVKMEQAVMAELETKHVRIPAFEALKHLVLCGNAMVYLPEKGVPKVFPLSHYVVERDGDGNVLQIIAKEDVSPSMLPQEVRTTIERRRQTGDLPPSTEKSVCVYTHVRREAKGDFFNSYQEVLGEVVPGSTGRFKAEAMPWIALRFHRVSGESYGRGLVEEYLGDLRSLEALTQAAVEGAAAASKVLFLVDPGSPTQASTLAKAPNGAIREGRAADVTVVQTNKAGDMQIAGAVMQRIEARLEHAFLLNSAFQRSGERVTAEEIRRMGEDLEMALGGAYSVLALEMQLPLVSVLTARMKTAGRLPKVDEKVVRPSVITGLEALGRGNDFTRITSFLQTAAASVGPDAIAQYVDGREVLAQLANASGLDASTLMKSEDQIAQENAMAQQQALVAQFGNQAVDKMVANAEAEGPPPTQN